MAVLCDMHSLMPVGFFTYLFMNDFFDLDVLYAVVI